MRADPEIYSCLEYVYMLLQVTISLLMKCSASVGATTDADADATEPPAAAASGSDEDVAVALPDGVAAPSLPAFSYAGMSLLEVGIPRIFYAHTEQQQRHNRL